MSQYSSIVQEFVDQMSKNPSLKEAMKSSFNIAYKTGLEEFDEYKIYSVDDYIRYLDDFLKWVPTENKDGRSVYMHICIFYFIIDMPPLVNWQNPIDPSQKAPWRWLTDWIKRYVQQIGLWMDSKESITQEAIDSFYKAENYHMQDYPVPADGWKTFNEFFARHIDLSKRPIAFADDDRIIVSPADCTFGGSWDVRAPEADINTFDVKGLEWTISQLLDDFKLGPTFAGGVLTHSFLAPSDYHRQHAPVAGKVVVAKVIQGICYFEVIFRESKSCRSGRELGARHSTSDPSKGEIIAPNSPGYQFLQARGLVLIESPLLGLVAVLPIGMAQVSSVVLSVTKGNTVKKGQEISYFQMGGSDIVMVFQKDANVKFQQTVGTHYNFGTHVATGGKN